MLHKQFLLSLGLPAARNLAPGLFGFAVLLAPCLPALAQNVPDGPCGELTTACMRAGFVSNSPDPGNGLVIDCIRPIFTGRPQPANARRPLPDVKPQVVAACKAADPDFGTRGNTFARPAAAPPAPAPVAVAGGDEEFAYEGDNYGWYDDGWNGPGWYIVGYEFRRGAGYGGPEGWHKWTHHGSHPHKGGGGHAGGGAPKHAGANPKPHSAPHHAVSHTGKSTHTQTHAVVHHTGGFKSHKTGGTHRVSGGGHRSPVRHTGGGNRHGGGGGHHGGGGHRHSDIRLKHDIVRLGHLDNGLGFYRFSYNGSDKAYVGVMAQEVQAVMPDAVVRGRDGYLLVDYDRLGIRMETWRQWVAGGKQIPATVRH